MRQGRGQRATGEKADKRREGTGQKSEARKAVVTYAKQRPQANLSRGRMGKEDGSQQSGPPSARVHLPHQWQPSTGLIT